MTATRTLVRFVAVASGPIAACCGHLHLREDLAERCRVRMARRLPGCQTKVARSLDEMQPCPLHAHHGDRPCPACGAQP